MRTFIAFIFGVILLIPAIPIALSISVWRLASFIEESFDSWMQESFK